MNKTVTKQNSWQEVKLGDIFAVQNGYSFKSSDYTEFISDELEVLKMGHIERGGSLRKGPKKNYVPRSEKLKKWILDKGNVVIAMTDMKDNVVILGVPALIDKDNHYVLNQRVAGLRLKAENVDLDFVYNYLKWNEFLGTLRSKANSGVQVNLTTDAIKNSIIILPPLPEQKAIAEVLSGLDDKIDLLHRQNKTLEDMARALFRRWFLPKGRAGVEEAKKDWEVVKLGDFFPIITGKKDANYSVKDGKYPFFTCAQGILSAPNYSFEGKAILLSGNGDFNVKRYNGKFEAYQRTYVLIPYEEKYFGFLYTLIRFYLDLITGGAQGSVIRFITKGMISDFKFLFPQKNIENKLEQMNEIYLKVDSNSSQIRTLENLRDTLLPKLMSGEVHLKGFNNA